MPRAAARRDRIRNERAPIRGALPLSGHAPMAKAAAHRRLATVAAAALLAAACGSSDIVTVESFGAVVTVVDSGPALGSARSFVLPDTVIRLSLDGTPIGPTLAHELVAEVRAHLVALGWTQLRDSAGSRPDVVVLLAASTKVQSGLAYADWFSSWGYLPY